MLRVEEINRKIKIWNARTPMTVAIRHITNCLQTSFGAFTWTQMQSEPTKTDQLVEISIPFAVSPIELDSSVSHYPPASTADNKLADL